MTKQSDSESAYRPIRDYGLVSNSHSAALIGSDGTVDWLCLPHFDSPAIFCRILDHERGGYLRILPKDPIRRKTRRYRNRSAVLETTLATDHGEMTITDAMPLTDHTRHAMLDGLWGGLGHRRLVRLLTAKTHPLDVELEAKVSLDFASRSGKISLHDGKGAIIRDGDTCYVLVWPGRLHRTKDGLLRGSLTLQPDKPLACALALVDSEEQALALLDHDGWPEEIETTDKAWQKWARRLQHRGPYRRNLIRSAVTLKMLSYEPTGAFVAAPTTSLPEVIGGVRNWDYRYCWLRDATLTLYALILGGDDDSAKAFLHWIGQACGGQPPDQIQIMYTIAGEKDMPERTLDHLAGYRNSAPVRVGNAAATQKQLDVYGELLDAVWFAYQEADEDEPLALNGHVWHLLRGIANYICEIWRNPDHGLWEMRQEPRHFVYSKLMCWVGLDRAINLSQAANLPGDCDRWQAEREAIRKDLLTHGYNEKVGAFTMSYGSDALDAATLRIPLVGFLPPDDPRVTSTIDQIQKHLRRDGLVLRYEAAQADDGLPAQEGAFAMCTFWLVDCLTAIGRLAEARQLFERMLSYGNDLGLFSEEIDPQTGEALGNYPQAFTHLALIGSGIDLTEALRQNKALPGEKSQRAHEVKKHRGQPAKGHAAES